MQDVLGSAGKLQIVGCQGILIMTEPGSAGFGSQMSPRALYSSEHRLAQGVEFQSVCMRFQQDPYQ